jgi:N-acetylglucosaminyldiphosphoundecaprenol N-acetyl-beta-D-mannosaminyltransferase
MTTVRLLNVDIDGLTMAEAVERLGRGGFVVTPNVDHLMKTQTNRAFLDVYRRADLRVCDSQILMFAARWLGTPLPEKISGSDLFPAFYTRFAGDETKRIFLLGAGPGVAARAAERINGRVGRRMVVDTFSPSFGFETNDAENDAILARINASGATVLAVGLGAPKQEMWIARWQHRLPDVITFLPIGATLDFEAGTLSRAPAWMSSMGLEWAYRLACEPKRLWKRYVGDALPFARLLVLQRLERYRCPFETAAPTPARVNSSATSPVAG